MTVPLNWWAGSFCIELEESGQNVLIGQIIRPAVGGEDGSVQFAVTHASRFFFDGVPTENA